VAPSTCEVTDVRKRITAISNTDAVLMLKEITTMTRVVSCSAVDVVQLCKFFFVSRLKGDT
jgi:hypothetical protein